MTPMVTLYTRADWGARKPRCTTPMPTAGVDRLARHWPGTTTDHLSSDPEDVARYLQGWQDWHMDGRGWCDIAYQYAVDLAGGVWTLRSYAHQSGAHTPWNEEAYAVLCVVGDQDRPTPQLLDGLAYLRGLALKRTPAAEGWYGHGQLPGTSTKCPGSYIRAITLTDLIGDDNMPTLAEIEGLLTKPRGDYGYGSTSKYSIAAAGPRYAWGAVVKLDEVQIQLARIEAAVALQANDEAQLTAAINNAATGLLAQITPVIREELADAQVTVDPAQFEAATERAVRRVLGGLDETS